MARKLLRSTGCQHPFPFSTPFRPASAPGLLLGSKAANSPTAGNLGRVVMAQSPEFGTEGLGFLESRPSRKHTVYHPTLISDRFWCYRSLA